MISNNNEQIEILKKQINEKSLPKHIAIIMDGNGRWAKRRLLPRTAGHREGVKRVEEIVEACGNLGIKFLTLYAFSTENWNRPKDEVDYLMKLLIEFLRKKLDILNENNVKLRVLGNIDDLDPSIKTEIIKTLEKTKNNNKLVLNIALNYGGRYEIVKACKNIVKDIINNSMEIEEISEETFKKYLYTSYQPDPDMLIRTSGELRVSNFLLYQIAYTEFLFSDVFWPDFTEEYLYRAIIDYQQRKRRFGGL